MVRILANSRTADDLLDTARRPLIIAQRMAFADADSFGYQGVGAVPLVRASRVACRIPHPTPL